jgi:hypothetical protein
MKLVYLLAVLISISCASFAQSARDIARVAFKSVVLLEMNDSNGQPLSLGSGFFVSAGVIATNAHVIEGASGGTARLVGDSRTMQISGTVAVDRHADLALLKVDSPAPPLALGPNANPTVGDDVYVVGNPLGLEGTFSVGIISGVRRVEADSILQMTAPISPGSSGGPVMNNSGAVIGISVATFRDGQNLNLAVPVSYLSKLMAAPLKGIAPLGDRGNVSQSRGSMLEGVGTKTEKGVVISDFHLDVGDPANYNYPDAGKYEFRLTNKLPVEICHLELRILYYDSAGALMDFEDPFMAMHDVSIPAGLARTILSYGGIGQGASEQSKHAAKYYYNASVAPKIEVRAINFETEHRE